jgi:hypothetical protein
MLFAAQACPYLTVRAFHYKIRKYVTTNITIKAIIIGVFVVTIFIIIIILQGLNPSPNTGVLILAGPLSYSFYYLPNIFLCRWPLSISSCNHASPIIQSILIPSCTIAGLPLRSAEVAEFMPAAASKGVNTVSITA